MMALNGKSEAQSYYNSFPWLHKRPDQISLKPQNVQLVMARDEKSGDHESQ